MLESLPLVPPRCPPALDPGFRPAALVHREFRLKAEAAGGVPLILGLERPDGGFSRHETLLLPADHADSSTNRTIAERLLKFLLWQRGACRVHVGGPAGVGEYLAATYAPNGARAFDHEFMGAQVYNRPFSVLPCRDEDVPPQRESTRALGRHLDGCRIGFDLGASDRKVAAVRDGVPVFSQETVWNPRDQSDPEYHYREIMLGLRAAAAHLPRVDAVGGSAAGVYVDNQPRVASLFRGVQHDRRDEVQRLFLRIQRELDVPLTIINDGEVAALAGSMSLERNAVLGIALGSSEAAGYVTRAGHLTTWLNELAFAPVDYAPNAPRDEWSGDQGTGALYLSQQCVFRLAPKAALTLPATATPAAQLSFAQEKLEAGDAGAAAIWQTMGTYLGYGLAHYADFYDLDHVLVLGRCTSGRGGTLLIEAARAVLATEFPELATRLMLHLPDETSRRVGQSIAAASLPAIPKKGLDDAAITH
jgi:predicted NBD/HSP70 family sugar kinase